MYQYKNHNCITFEYQIITISSNEMITKVKKGPPN
jgi:hypothetical protein